MVGILPNNFWRTHNLNRLRLYFKTILDERLGSTSYRLLEYGLNNIENSPILQDMVRQRSLYTKGFKNYYKGNSLNTTSSQDYTQDQPDYHILKYFSISYFLMIKRELALSNNYNVGSGSLRRNDIDQTWSPLENSTNASHPRAGHDTRVVGSDNNNLNKLQTRPRMPTAVDSGGIKKIKKSIHC